MLNIHIKTFALPAMASVIIYLLSAAALALPAYAAGAADGAVCVACTGPDKTYRCNVVGEDGSPLNTGLQYICISEIAREMGHQSCAVGRRAASDCQGVEKTIVYNGTAPQNPLAQGEGGTGFVTSTTGSGEPGIATADEHAGEPKTLLELTDQTVKKTQAQIKKTGQTISDATKATGQKIGDAAKATGQGITDAAKKTGDTVGSAVKTTGQTVVGAVKKSGEVVGGAAKSTYHCIASFFTDCF